MTTRKYLFGNERENEMNDEIRVMTIKPFWRYAVLPDALPNEPAMPFYTKKAALAFIESVKAGCSPITDYKMLLFRKVWFKRIEEIAKI